MARVFAVDVLRCGKCGSRLKWIAAITEPDVIARIPEVDTETARETIKAQLLKEPRDYIESCAEVLARDAKDLSLTVELVVAMGHRLSEYENLIQEHEVDLLVINTKDEDQFAMHGIAYPLAVEMRQIPLLML